MLIRPMGTTIDPNAWNTWGNGFDDLSAAAADFARVSPPVGPTGGGSAGDLFNSVASNSAYQGTIQPSGFGAFLTKYAPWIIGGSAGLVLLNFLKGGRR